MNEIKSVRNSPLLAGRSRSRENLQVVVRLRPIPTKDQEHGETSAFKITSLTTLDQQQHSAGSAQQQHSWAFDRVFDSAASSDHVYQQVVKDLIQSAMQGINTCIMAYGQTASGKTHTMKALTQAAACDIFEAVASSSDREWHIRASAIEVYNEEARDLLKDDRQEIRLRSDRHQGTVIEGLQDQGMHSAQHLLRMLKAVEFRRQVRETKHNVCSSRSHLVVRIHIESRPSTSAVDSTADAASVRVSVLDFVDLAGAEQVGKEFSAVSDKSRHTEGVYINQSLLALRKVIKGLAEGERHIAYRESKLTRLLQPSLSGNARTAMICTINPAASHVEQSRRVLQFATDHAKRIVLEPQVNEIAGGAGKLQELQREIDKLKQQLANAAVMQENTQQNKSMPAAHSAVLQENEELAAALLVKEQQLHMTAKQAEAAERKLKNLERLILRGNPAAIKARASWSPATGISEHSKTSPPPTHQSTLPAAISASWNPGAPAKSPLGSTCKTLAYEDNNGDRLFLDILLPSLQQRKSTFQPRSRPEVPQAVPLMQASDPKAAEEARAALRAEVTCFQLLHQPSGFRGKEGMEATIQRLQTQLKAIEEQQDVMEAAQRQSHVAAMQQEIHRLQEEHQMHLNVNKALSSLQHTLNSVETPRLSEDGHPLDGMGAVCADADYDTVQWQHLSPDLTPASSTTAGHSGFAGSSQRHIKLDAGAVDESVWMPNMGSPVQATPAVAASNSSFWGRMSFLRPAASEAFGTPAAMNSFTVKDRNAPDSSGATPPQGTNEEMRLWYKSKLHELKQRMQEQTNSDIMQLKNAIEQKDEVAERLKHQKQLLVEQLCHLELKLEEVQRTAAEREQLLAQQLLAAKKELADRGAASAQLHIRASSAEVALAPPQPSGNPGGLAGGVSPGANPLSMAVGEDLLDWAAGPSKESLLFKIVTLWEKLSVPLIHRSHWYLAFQEKDFFYFEAEHRRLNHLQTQLTSAQGFETQSPAKNPLKRLEAAQRRLEWERKWLMQQLKFEFAEAEREELFLKWNIHRESKERKAQLIRKLWRQCESLDHDMMKESSLLVMHLNNMDVDEGSFELVFGKTEGDSWVRSLANTSGALVKPLLNRITSTPSKHSIQRRSSSSSLIRQLTPRRHSISSFTGWGSKDTPAAASPV